MSKTKRPRTTGQKIVIVAAAAILIALLVALILVVIKVLNPSFIQNKGEHAEFSDPIYSVLTGEEISDAAMNQSPTFCVQIPNGTDGGRPQAGLTDAAVVFEAIAEAGITRFAAVFQNATVGAIGPIRSLRPYYLDWDTPFNCTIVHSGGSDEALAALRTSGQRDLDESLTYMWRENTRERYWNNLFTSPKLLLDYNLSRNYTTSSLKAFARLTPEQVNNLINARNACAADETCAEAEVVSSITLRFGAVPAYNTVYTYNPETNTYLRSYANGSAHLTYACPSDLNAPNTYTDCGEPVQVNPSVVVAMVVQETRMADNYHENITTIGTGAVTIFQNGEVVEGTWTKSSQSSQLIFRDYSGNEIKLTPGQLWIAAIPQYGSIDY